MATSPIKHADGRRLTRSGLARQRNRGFNPKLASGDVVGSFLPYGAGSYAIRPPTYVRVLVRQNGKVIHNLTSPSSKRENYELV